MAVNLTRATKYKAFSQTNWLHAGVLCLNNLEIDNDQNCMLLCLISEIIAMLGIPNFSTLPSASWNIAYPWVEISLIYIPSYTS